MRKEWIESKNAAADPFTRQSCRPVLGEILRLHPREIKYLQEEIICPFAQARNIEK